MKKNHKKNFNVDENLKLNPSQVAIFELCMLSGGALFALYLPEFFISIERLLWILLILPGLYICYIHFKQSNK